MASDNSFEGLECSVCLESMLDKRPVVLPCMHTFCTPCVTGFYKPPRLTCPTCRAETAVPEGDIYNLPVNRDLVKFLEREKEMKRDLVNCCEFCLRKEIRQESSGVCTQCVKKLCKGCIRQHKQVSAFRNHQIASRAVSSAQEEDKCCPVHREPLQYVCMKCVDNLCIYCTTEEKHANHPNQIKTIETGIKNLRQRHTRHKAKIDDYMRLFSRIKDAISTDFAALKKPKDDLRELRLLFQRKLSEIDELQQQVSTQEVFMQNSDAAIAKLIDRTKRLQNDLKAAERYSDIQFVNYSKATFKDTDVLHQIGKECKKMPSYQIPRFEMHQTIASNKLDFSQNPVGKIVYASGNCQAASHFERSESCEAPERSDPYYSSEEEAFFAEEEEFRWASKEIRRAVEQNTVPQRQVSRKLKKMWSKNNNG